MSKKASGILIHPTSFFGPYGCGDLGEGAYRFVDWLKKAGQKILQVLPLGPTGFGDSPYQSFSAFAGTPYVISFDKLIEKGLLAKEDLKDYPKFEPKRVDYYGIYINNFKILRKAFDNFKNLKENKEYKDFTKENSFWLDDYALFMAIKDSKNGASWDAWEDDLKLRKNLSDVSDAVKDSSNFYKFIQFEFFQQWTEFKKYAEKQGVEIVGDAPIFVSYDSADVWANQSLFYLDKNGKPEIVAGVPPDYFSETGQLWGNPHYKWTEMKKDDYSWWKRRIGHLLQFVDCVRVDHFRGFEAYWEVKYGEPTAMNGKWVKAPGMDFFNSLKKEYGEKLGDIVIAEDLGIITKEVNELKNTYKLPGMKIFEFAPFSKGTFTDDNGVEKDNSKHPYLPDNYEENCVGYPGTHDNDTLYGWFYALDSIKQKEVMDYLSISDKGLLNWAVIEKLLNSKANRVVFTIQDVLGLTSDCRMNTPGTCGIHNWSWRITEKLLTDETASKLLNLTKKSGRF